MAINIQPLPPIATVTQVDTATNRILINGDGLSMKWPSAPFFEMQHTAGLQPTGYLTVVPANTVPAYFSLEMQDNADYRAIVLNQGGGHVGIGLNNPATKLHVHITYGEAFSVEPLLTLSKNTEDEPEPGFGTSIAFNLQTTTTEDTPAAKIEALWNTSAHATRKADLVLSAYDTTAREGIRIRGAGSGAAIGFYGVTPITRAVLPTGASKTVDNVITALQNLGLVQQS